MDHPSKWRCADCQRRLMPLPCALIGHVSTKLVWKARMQGWAGGYVRTKETVVGQVFGGQKPPAA